MSVPISSLEKENAADDNHGLGWVGRHPKYPELEDDVWSEEMQSTVGWTAQRHHFPVEGYTGIFTQKFLKEVGFGVF